MMSTNLRSRNRRAAAKLHAFEVDLEVVHDGTFFRIDDDIENDLPIPLVHIDDRTLRGEVYSVVNIHVFHAHVGDILADAALVHVRLIRQNERGGDVADGKPSVSS